MYCHALCHDFVLFGFTLNHFKHLDTRHIFFHLCYFFQSPQSFNHYEILHLLQTSDYAFICTSLSMCCLALGLHEYKIVEYVIELCASNIPCNQGPNQCYLFNIITGLWTGINGASPQHQQTLGVPSQTAADYCSACSDLQCLQCL